MTSAAPLLPEQKEMMMATNMTSLEQDLKKQILGRSKAEKVFRPWWDTLEDYLLNSLVLLGESLLFYFDPIVSIFAPLAVMHQNKMGHIQRIPVKSCM